MIRTHSGDPVGMDGFWLALGTSFVEGPVIRPSLAQLRMLGAALGTLHALEQVSAAGQAPWYPEAAIPATMGRLDAVEALVPDDLGDLYGQLRTWATAS